jgi:hypothetical protein
MIVFKAAHYVMIVNRNIPKSSGKKKGEYNMYFLYKSTSRALDFPPKCTLMEAWRAQNARC